MSWSDITEGDPNERQREEREGRSGRVASPEVIPASESSFVCWS
jgi:hypothetical protein